MASIAATGFWLIGLAIAAHRKWIAAAEAAERARATLRFFASHATQEHGWFYHFLDAATGEPAGKSELSSIDTALLLAGMLTFANTALKTMRERFGDKIWGRYGFCDAFNPTTGWTDIDVFGIDQGITLLSAENLRSESLWHWFARNPEIPHALKLCKFHRQHRLARIFPAIQTAA